MLRLRLLVFPTWAARPPTGGVSGCLSSSVTSLVTRFTPQSMFSICPALLDSKPSTRRFMLKRREATRSTKLFSLRMLLAYNQKLRETLVIPYRTVRPATCSTSVALQGRFTMICVLGYSPFSLVSWSDKPVPPRAIVATMMGAWLGASGFFHRLRESFASASD